MKHKLENLGVSLSREAQKQVVGGYIEDSEEVRGNCGSDTEARCFWIGGFCTVLANDNCFGLINTYMSKLFIILSILFTTNIFTQNGLINGEVHNYTSSDVPFSIQNPLYKYKLHQILKKQDSSFKIRMSIDKPSIVNIAYVPIFIKPHDTLNFSFTFTPTPINDYEYFV